MNTIQLKLTVIIVILLLKALTSNTFAQDNVLLGIYIKDMAFSDERSVFECDLYWWVKYKVPNDTALRKEIQKIEFTNAETIEKEIYETKVIDSIEYVTGHFRGKFRYNPDYISYPLDKQSLPLNIESVTLTNNRVTLLPDTVAYMNNDNHIVGFDPNILLPGFSIKEAHFSNSVKDYQTNFGDPAMKNSLTYSRLTYTILIERRYTPFILKILIPNVLLLIIAYMVFFIPAKQLEVAVGCTVTSLLAGIALQLAINFSLPDVGYLTKADKLFYLFYSLITFALVQTVLSFRLEQSGRANIANVTEKIGRIFYPIIAVGGILTICLS